MSRSTLTLNSELYAYLLDHSIRETGVQQELREATEKLANARMQISPEQGQFMALLLKLIGAQRVIEIGTFTGYSTLCMAQALPDDSQIIACDINAEWTRIGREFWKKAGVEHKIDLRLAPALTTLQNLSADGMNGTFDFAFIDADKENILGYYDWCFQLVKSGGLIAIDNVLWGGSVVDVKDQSADTKAIRILNAFVRNDSRVDISLLPVGDGLTLARKI